MCALCIKIFVKVKYFIQADHPKWSDWLRQEAPESEEDRDSIPQTREDDVENEDEEEAHSERIVV